MDILILKNKPCDKALGAALGLLSSSGPGPGPRSGPGQVPGQVQKVQGLRTKELDLG